MTQDAALHSIHSPVYLQSRVFTYGLLLFSLHASHDAWMSSHQTSPSLVENPGTCAYQRTEDRGIGPRGFKNTHTLCRGTSICKQNMV